MAEDLREWLKMILYADVLLWVCSMLLEKTRYEKYIRLFSGFMILSCLIQPVLSLTRTQDYLDASWIRSSLKSELDAMRDEASFDGMEKTVLDNYEQILQKQVTRMGDACGIRVDYVKVYWNSSQDGVEALKITGKKIEDQKNIPDILGFQGSLVRFYQIDSDNIELYLK